MRNLELEMVEREGLINEAVAPFGSENETKRLTQSMATSKIGCSLLLSCLLGANLVILLQIYKKPLCLQQDTPEVIMSNSTLLSTSSSNQDVLYPHQINVNTTHVHNEDNIVEDSSPANKEPLLLQQDTPEVIMSNSTLLSSYTYSHCPFTYAKFSQYRMAHQGPFESEPDREINSLQRAELALNFSNGNLAYDRVVKSLESGGFDGRNIILDGDSLTRQFFISLGCLAWNAGYVEHYILNNISVLPPEENTITKSAGYDEPISGYSSGQISLRGGGMIYYYNKSSAKNIKSKTEEFVKAACYPKKTEKKNSGIKLYVGWNDKINMGKNDVYVVAGGGHHNTRPLYMELYKSAFQCIKDAQDHGEFENWPHLFYQLSSESHFNTRTGHFSEGVISGRDPNSCRKSISRNYTRSEDKDALKTTVSFLGNSINVQALGKLHVGHGDCLHWVQPGVPDVYAGELADFLYLSKKKIKND